MATKRKKRSTNPTKSSLRVAKHLVTHQDPYTTLRDKVLRELDVLTQDLQQLNIEYIRTTVHTGQNSPTLDKLNPTLGYVKGNVAIISHLANSMKQNVTDPAAFRRLADWLEENGFHSPD